MSLQKYNWENWNDIDWKVVEVKVWKLQKRIFRASLSGDVKLVHRLQKLLTKSYFAKLLAVRKVTQDNAGKKTAGVDKVKSIKPESRFELANKLVIGKTASPLRRVWIPKADGTKRGLGIPTIEDRAKQALLKLAIEPEWEAKFEENSYGFRPGRGCHDAIDAIWIAINHKDKFVLDADISGCFDNIDHDKLLKKLDTTTNFRKQIKAWLKCGVMDNLILKPTISGTPQGGVISPLLANIALHGMEELVKSYAGTLKGCKKANEKSLNLIRYADDFVVLHKDENVVKECKVIITEWLKEIGLELKPSKTKLTHTLYYYNGNVGFDFLGFTVRQFPVGKTRSGKSTRGKLLGFKTIITPSKSKIKKHLDKVGEVIRGHNSAPQEALISRLNPILRGWANYYSTVCSKDTFSYGDSVIYQQLKRWAERRHPKKSKSWVKDRYWRSDYSNGKTRNWVFGYGHDKCHIDLYKHADKAIIRHIKVRGNKSPFDGDIVYWASRLGKDPEISTSIAKMLKKQKGKCNHCGLTFVTKDWEIDHIIPKSKGGKDYIENLQLLHKHCHDVKTANDGSNQRKRLTCA
jgi:RNA-directed DNA polymerase